MLVRGLIVLAALCSVAPLSRLFLPPSVGAFVSVSHPDYFKEMDDPRNLVGSSHNVIFGEVIKMHKRTRRREPVGTQYGIGNLEVYLGSPSGEVRVDGLADTKGGQGPSI